MGGETMADTLFVATNVCYVVAIAAFILAIVLFIRWKIPVVIDDLSGKRVKRTVGQMQKHDKKTGTIAYYPGKLNEQRENTAVSERGKSEMDDEKSRQTEQLNTETEETVLLRSQEGIQVMEEIVYIHTDENI